MTHFALFGLMLVVAWLGFRVWQFNGLFDLQQDLIEEIGDGVLAIDDAIRDFNMETRHGLNEANRSLWDCLLSAKLKYKYSVKGLERMRRRCLTPEYPWPKPPPV